MRPRGKHPNPAAIRHQGLTYSDIARIIASEAGLLAVVDDTGTYERVCRKDSNKSYFAFLDELAKRADRKFYMDGQTMYFV